jgi:hypothetical protein
MARQRALFFEFINVLMQARAVSDVGALALVLISPLFGEPSIGEIDEGKLAFVANAAVT